MIQSEGINRRYRKAVRALLITTTLLIVILITLPFAIQWGIEKGLQEAEYDQISLGDVDFNPFTGQLSLKQLKAKKKGAGNVDFSLLKLQIKWFPLFKKRIEIVLFLLEKGELTIGKSEQDKLILGGFELPEGSEKEQAGQKQDEPGWSFGLGKISLYDYVVDLQLEEFDSTVEINELSLIDLFSWKGEQSADFSVDLTVDGKPVNAKLDIAPFAVEPVYQGKLHLKNLELSKLQSLLKDHLKQLSGNLTTDLDLVVNASKKGIFYKQKGMIELSNSALSTEQLEVRQDKIGWRGKLETKIAQESIELTTNGGIKIEGHTSQLSSPELKSELDNLMWEGGVSLRKMGEEIHYSVKGDLSTIALTTKNDKTGTQLVALEKFKAKELAIDNHSKIEVASTVVDKFTVADSKNSLFKGERIELDQLALTNLNQIKLEHVKIDSVTSNITIDKKGNLTQLKRIKTSLLPTSGGETSPETDSAIEEAEVKSFQYRVGQVVITGSNQINLKMESANNGALEKKITLKKFKVGEIDSNNPRQKTPINVEAIIDSHSNFSTNGVVTPISEKRNGEVQSHITALELHDFSPYIRELLGYEIVSGQLNGQFDIKMKDDILDGLAKLEINQLEMQAVDQEKIAVLSNQLSMPLNSALSLLRDKENDIKLDIPIKGDVGSPDFKLGDVINKAIGNAMQGTVTSYLKYALQPYGLIYMAAEKTYGAATAVRFEPVRFQATSDKLSEQAREYLGKIGQLMQKRPALRIKVCGVASNKDLMQLEQQNLPDIKEKKVEGTALAELVGLTALNLAKRRGDAVKRYLVSKYSIEPVRLFTCLPKVSDGDSEGKVELTL